MNAPSKINFASNQEVRWCPGCGDFAILAAMQRFLAGTDLQPDNIVFVSGIGCAGRFPYYMNSYGFHTIHGRAPAVALGIKKMNPDLSVWLITGDGDGLSIGTNHLLHTIRRNPDINILLFNNQIYGLTKGQFSPTSVKGLKTKTSPTGVSDMPLSPLKLALAANASFIARGLDKDPKHLTELFQKAHAHKGTAFIEIFQNCNIFNDGAFEPYDNKTKRLESVLYLEHNKPLAFGGDNKKSLVSSANGLTISESSDPLMHDKTSITLANQLLSLSLEEHPLPLGVMYQKERNIFSPQKKTINATDDDLKALLNE